MRRMGKKLKSHPPTMSLQIEGALYLRPRAIHAYPVRVGELLNTVVIDAVPTFRTAWSLGHAAKGSTAQPYSFL
ncbi:hypothetical protein EVAR_55200_1 [Eumeta japonica]|uniref:Uncharacterized protein n=1 Tax=Eumeta variegata TaxID=151549 RepID=A0A4C1ZEU6_EUMVA|nr:hypothetical protein EVAR_55200_1 [Eumeta japonica]